MNKSTLFFGIDISKDRFDVYGDPLGHRSYPNTREGFSSFLKVLDRSSHCVMEATGCYHHKLSMFLHEKNIVLSVINPVVIKRFIQMKLKRVKTDKSDAFMIYNYAQEQVLEPWRPEPAYIVRSKELLSLMQTYSRQSTALKNKLHALENRGHGKSMLVTSIKRQLRNLKKEGLLLEK